MEKGFFAFSVLLAAWVLILAQLSSSVNLHTDYEILNTNLLEIEKNSFTRAETETYIDNLITSSLLSTLPLEADLVKAEVNGKILNYLKEPTFSGIFLCKMESAGVYLPTGEKLEAKKLSAASNVLIMKTGPALILEYTISGGINADRAPCAIIKNGAAQTLFVLPVGYSVRVVR